MKYERFEWLIIALAAAAVGGTILVSVLGGTATFEETVAQVLLFGVLAAAVHWGRNGGFIAAVGAMVVYIAIRAPVIAADGLTPEILTLVLVRAAVYGFVGIVGGEICGRMKYMFAALEDSLNVDALTRVYTGRFLSSLVSTQVGLHARHGQPFSVVLVALAPSLTAGFSASRRRSLLRSVANRIRTDVRLVDDVGRLEDGTFVLLLPQTPRDGAEVAARRVRSGVAELLGVTDGSVTSATMGAPQDTAAIEALRDRIDAEVEAAVQSSS